MKIFICGDSTAASYNAEETAMVGWGQALGEMLSGVEVVNLAKAGRSTRTFLAEDRLAPAAEQGGPGDLMIIQFAHNDENREKPERYAPAWTVFQENLRFFVRFARKKGMVPVLMTPICMRVWSGGVLQPTHGEYPAAMRAVAVETKTRLIDMYAESFRIVEQMGEEGSRALFMGRNPTDPNGKEDNAHTRRAGAEAFASCAARLLKEQGLI